MSSKNKKKKKPFIAVYGIYKNEQTFMKRFLESVKTADEIVLCDTGAKDETNEIISDFKKRNPECKLKTVPIYVSPWRFDDARNAALSLVNPEADVCISLDIDEYFMENWKEYLVNQYEEGIKRYYHKFKNFWTDGSVSEHWHERIHARKGFTWKLPVHEILEYSEAEKIKWLPDFWVYQKPEKKDSRQSYLSLLEQSVKERKDIWKSWSFLANEYIMEQKYDYALKAVDNALEIADSDKAFLYKQKYLVYKLQGNIDLAVLNLNTAIFHMPERREIILEKARFLNDTGRHIEAYFTILEAEKRTEKIIDYHYESSAWEDDFYNLKSDIYNLAKEEGLKL